MEKQQIKNIIFDLGGVIINLDQERTFAAFADLAGIDLQSARGMMHTFEEFMHYELGLIQDKEFMDFLKSKIDHSSKEEILEKAWNAMLVDIPRERVELIKALRQRYRVVLLSNTNRMHIREVNRILGRDTGHQDLEELFDELYYSFLLQKRKPGAEIFEFVLEKEGFNPGETLFLDDSKENIESAAKLGIQTVHVDSPRTLQQHFS